MMETGNIRAEGTGVREPAARRPTIDHVTLRVSDLPASRRFYEAIWIVYERGSREHSARPGLWRDP
jgi:hypothetical protein